MNRSALQALLVLLFFSIAHASPQWVFSPQKAGRALLQGGWTVEHSLGTLNASPEFSFPLQLVYLNTREQKGLFGSQWFCPQLESSVIPKGPGVFAWTMPSGGMMGFRVGPNRATDYVSFDGNWRARVNGPSQTIFNAEGWTYSYTRGRLDSIASPTRRLLEFVRSGTLLQYIQIRDTASAARRVLLTFAYAENKRAAIINLNGQSLKFGYFQDGPDDRLAVYAPAHGPLVRFAYQPGCGVLLSSHRVSGEAKAKPFDEVTYRTSYAKPFDGNEPSKEQGAKANPKNHWIIEDLEYKYTYGTDPGNKDHWLPEQIRLEGKTGITQDINLADKRGIVSTRQDDQEQKTYFYRAPGQKHDGKLRRVERDGKLVAEYRYARKTGLMTEMIDAAGLITFFDYPADWKPARLALWEPKPIRVRRGDRRKAELVAEFAYNDLGRMIWSKDAAGQVTRYTYTNRGELAAVTDPLGDTTAFEYDAFGRRTAVAKGRLRESVVYDEVGRIKTHLSPDGTRTDLSFDKSGQLAGIQRDGKSVVEYLRDDQGRITGERDPLGRVKKLERDPRGSLLAETAPNGSVTRYEYDEFNRRTAQIDGNGNKIAFAYDPAGRLIRQANALGGVLTWKYDHKGRLVERSNGEQVITSSYDKDGRLACLDYGSGQTIDYLYDKEGRLLSQASPRAGVAYAYDKLGRLEAARYLLKDGEEQLLRYRYDARGQRTGLLLARLVPEVPSAGGRAGQEARYETLLQTEYTYEGGRLASIASNGKPVVCYRYDAGGRLAEKTFGNGMKATVTSDAMGRLATMEFSDGPLTKPHLLAYEWNAGNQVTRRAWNGEVQYYEYDPSGQLLKVFTAGTQDGLTQNREDAGKRNIASTPNSSPPNPQLTESYAYDKAGNMLEKVLHGEKSLLTYNAANQLVRKEDGASPGQPTSRASSYFYDRAGRLLGSSDGPRNTYGWLDKVTILTQPDGTQIQYDYWPDGQLAAKRIFAAKSTKTTEDKGIRQIALTGLDRESPGEETPMGVTRTPFPPHSPPAAQEDYLWDGLALLRRSDTIYIIEPHPSGGVPVASYELGTPAKATYFLNDMLGTTLATVEGSNIRHARLTAFGQSVKIASRPSITGSGLSDNPLPDPIPQTDSMQKTP